MNLNLRKADASPLRVTPCQVHGLAAVRGTVQHVVLEREDSAMNIAQQETIPITVTCFEEARGLDAPIHYALAVSLEMAPGLNIPIYEQVAQRLRVRAPVAIRASR